MRRVVMREEWNPEGRYSIERHLLDVRERGIAEDANEKAERLATCLANLIEALVLNGSLSTEEATAVLRIPYSSADRVEIVED